MIQVSKPAGRMRWQRKRRSSRSNRGPATRCKRPLERPSRAPKARYEPMAGAELQMAGSTRSTNSEQSPAITGKTGPEGSNCFKKGDSDDRSQGTS